MRKNPQKIEKERLFMKMPKIQRKDKRSMLDKEIDKILAQMEKVENVLSDEYEQLSDRLGKLMEMKGQKGFKEVRKLDPNTVIVVVGGITEIILIMTYEQGHVIATKAFSRVLRGRA